ncbi:MAG: RNA 2',3'-cyclic phosphodiesterase [Gammaproteobacteria bacterium]|nr:RNA 2',3'-cyclic phosphodiesterase [Gammaproteobacteria bacterium]MDH3534727.1 RNA 2',3'-cyclic phosphodiesterase [Gammaproteobacteria bacterium]
MREKEDARIFFALWPDPATRQRLSQSARQLPVERPARRVPDYNLHLTLHFVGNVGSDELTCLRQRARRAPGEAFELLIDGAGHFARSRVAWLGCSEIPPALQRLHDRLGGCLEPCGYQPDTRRFNPHVTVARNMIRFPLVETIAPISWQVDSFELIESRAFENGVKYEVVETYPIA